VSGPVVTAPAPRAHLDGLGLLARQLEEVVLGQLRPPHAQVHGRPHGHQLHARHLGPRFLEGDGVPAEQDLRNEGRSQSQRRTSGARCNGLIAHLAVDDGEHQHVIHALSVNEDNRKEGRKEGRM